ncbi:MAG: hypothetical protein F6K30_07665 [Cyanothece sp. SIO2G6]|nr:hypothetical protein [Cyanothece sp. SIO2G6]
MMYFPVQPILLWLWGERWRNATPKGVSPPTWVPLLTFRQYFIGISSSRVLRVLGYWGSPLIPSFGLPPKASDSSESSPHSQYLESNGTDIRLVGSAHPTLYQHFQRSQFAYVSAIDLESALLFLSACLSFTVLSV